MIVWWIRYYIALNVAVQTSINSARSLLSEMGSVKKFSNFNVMIVDE